MRDRNTKHCFEVQELRRNSKEIYCLAMTDEEMSRYLKSKREVNGYISGVGGDKSYSIIAWYLIA